MVYLTLTTFENDSKFGKLMFIGTGTPQCEIHCGVTTQRCILHRRAAFGGVRYTREATAKQMKATTAL